MQVDISKELPESIALDRWENEGGRAPSDRRDLAAKASLGSVKAQPYPLKQRGTGRRARAVSATGPSARGAGPASSRRANKLVQFPAFGRNM